MSVKYNKKFTKSYLLSLLTALSNEKYYFKLCGLIILHYIFLTDIDIDVFQ